VRSDAAQVVIGQLTSHRDLGAPRVYACVRGGSTDGFRQPSSSSIAVDALAGAKYRAPDVPLCAWEAVRACLIPCARSVRGLRPDPRLCCQSPTGSRVVAGVGSAYVDERPTRLEERRYLIADCGYVPWGTVRVAAVLRRLGRNARGRRRRRTEVPELKDRTAERVRWHRGNPPERHQVVASTRCDRRRAHVGPDRAGLGLGGDVSQPDGHRRPR
jgi:hypothetical protein